MLAGGGVGEGLGGAVGPVDGDSVDGLVGVAEAGVELGWEL